MKKMFLAVAAACFTGAAGLVALPSTSSATVRTLTSASVRQGNVQLGGGLSLPPYTQKTTLVFWAWAGPNAAMIKLFNKDYPSIKIDWYDVGASTAEYAKLTTALAANSGIPDVVELEYPYVLQYAVKGQLANIAKWVAPYKTLIPAGDYALEEYKGGIYGAPGGPGWMGLSYQPGLLSKYHLPVPTTYAQYASDAIALHKDDPSEYMTYFPLGDEKYLAGLMQQIGAEPFAPGKSGNWVVNINSPDMEHLFNYWGGLIKDGAVQVSTDYTPSWEHEVAAGTFATYLIPQWGPGSFDSYVKPGTQAWALTHMPEWAAGVETSGNWAGGGYSVMSASKDQEAAALFALFQDLAPAAIQLTLTPAAEGGGGGIPAAVAASSYKEFSAPVPDYVTKDMDALFLGYSELKDNNYSFNYGPWFTEFSTVLESELTSAVEGKISYDAALAATQSQLVSYVQGEGYSVTACKTGVNNDAQC
ncbi:MAG TPA: extracellular solute-binding protein [Acidimicrobiales bacterium]|nr:extracellular solute-binding protein [Acidimicrobiales bacterium]